MKVRPYQLVSGGFFCIAIILAIVFEVYIFSLPTSYDTGNILIGDFVVIGLLIWVGSVILFRHGKSQSGSQFIRTIIMSLLPVTICLGIYWVIVIFLAFRNFSF